MMYYRLVIQCRVSALARWHSQARELGTCLLERAEHLKLGWSVFIVCNAVGVQVDLLRLLDRQVLLFYLSSKQVLGTYVLDLIE